MGFNFRKSVKILPGVRMNVSKSGTSFTIGGKVASVNVKKGRKTKTTIGIPGTGISHTSYSGQSTQNTSGDPSGSGVGIGGWAIAIIFGFILYKIFS